MCTIASIVFGRLNFRRLYQIIPCFPYKKGTLNYIIICLCYLLEIISSILLVFLLQILHRSKMAFIKKHGFSNNIELLLKKKLSNLTGWLTKSHPWARLAEKLILGLKSPVHQSEEDEITPMVKQTKSPASVISNPVILVSPKGALVLNTQQHIS